MSEVLRNLSDALAGTVEQTGAGVVRVEGRRRLPATGVVWSEDGLVITAHHVVENDENLQVGLPNGETVAATLVGRDPGSDIAVLRVQSKLTPVRWATDADVLRVGHLVLAMGRPGQSVQATLGVVSAIGENMEENIDVDVMIRKVMSPHMGPQAERWVERTTEKVRRRAKRWGPHMMWMARGTGVQGAIQTDVTMYPGFSGGPLVDASGVVYGINTSALRGASMTIPVQAIRNVAESLLQHGRIRRGFLGIGAQPVRLPEAQQKELDQETGLLIVSVESGSPAENGGIFLGDIIVALDGQAVAHLEELLSLLNGERVGKEVPLQIIRGGQLQEIQVTIGEKL